MSDADNEFTDGECTYGLVVPFIACESNGGPFDDPSFVAGYAVGQIDQQLADGDTTSRLVLDSLVPQIDLMAFRHGYQTTVEPLQDGWVHVDFERRLQLV